MVLEVTVVRIAWMLSFGPGVLVLQVIWAIGVSMLVLAVLVQGPRWLPLAFGAVLVLGHDLLDGVVPETFGSLA